MSHLSIDLSGGRAAGYPANPIPFQQITNGPFPEVPGVADLPFVPVGGAATGHEMHGKPLLCAKVIASAWADGTWRSLVAHLTGGQGVAGSNPAVPTRRSRSEGVPGSHSGPFPIFGSQSGSHVFVASVSAGHAFGDAAWPVLPGE